MFLPTVPRGPAFTAAPADAFLRGRHQFEI